MRTTEELIVDLVKLTIEKFINPSLHYPNRYRILSILKEDGIATNRFNSDYLISAYSREWKFDNGELLWFTGGMSEDLDDLSNWHCDRIELNCSQYRFDGNEHFVVFKLCDEEFMILVKSKEISLK